MSAEPLAVYVNDHLAGSTAGLSLMDDLATKAEGTALAPKLRALAAEVREDQQLLRDTLDRLAVGERRVAQAAAWLGEKVSEGRLALAARTHPALALLESLESIALGLQGKLAIFRVLAELGPLDPRLAGLPYAARADRTAVQHGMIEAERRAAAREAFTTVAAGPP
ncbi:MAG TPA: hypothetical protein VJQ46_07920 [Gemmatimonadales bacterium]|nr:hypothetical protein [Gemmatimonadales bacterium]